jgi:hypothetical protein
MVGQSGPTGWWSKKQAADPHSRTLKPRASLFYLSEFGNYLVHNFHPEGFFRRVPKHELHYRRHHRPNRNKIYGHLDVAESSDPHPLRQMIPYPWWINNGKAQLKAPGL